MKFRPCIDIHNGKVKQIVGGTLSDNGACENFIATNGADYYAKMYKRYGLTGGHVIILNKAGTAEYEASIKEVINALHTYPNGLQVGGGINSENANDFIRAGASHIIVTSYIFEDGKLSKERLDSLLKAVGKERIVLDLSCRYKEDGYYVVVDRWQTFTNLKLTQKTFNELAEYCDEFLIHGVDVEGMKQGIDEELLKLLATINHTITYAGGIKDEDDVELINKIGNGRIDFTVGSALDIFGGNLSFTEMGKKYANIYVEPKDRNLV